MPGIDESRFIGLRQSDEELMCGICLAILNQPLVTPCCSQTYCGDCLRQWLRNNNSCPNDRQKLDAKDVLQPPRLINNKRMLDKLHIKCDFYAKGCDKHISLGRLKEHVKTCGYNPDAICLVSGYKNGDLDEHHCNSNLLSKAKNLEISNEELTKKHNAYVANATKHIKDKDKLIDEINDKNVKLNKRLKSYKLEANKRMKLMDELSAKSNRQLNDLNKKLSDLRTELTQINRNFQSADMKLDAVVNKSNREESAKQKNGSLVNVMCINYIVRDVRSFRTNGFECSPPKFEFGFKWQIKVEYYIDSKRNERLKFFLECNNLNKFTKWSFDASVQLTIIGTNPGGRSYTRQQFKRKFTHEDVEWSYQRFILLSEIFGPKNGFRENDSINLLAIISPDIRSNADSDYIIDSDSDSDSD